MSDPSDSGTPDSGSIEGVCVPDRINYVELPATDVAAMKRFYGAVFGWSFTDWGESYAEIVGAGVSGGIDGEGRVPTAPGGPQVMVYSDDLDAALAKVRGAGGEVFIDPFDFPGGRRFHFRDPSANELAVWTAVPMTTDD